MSAFFIFKQKTAYEMRISDWSSDVCSSDLRECQGDGDGNIEADHRDQGDEHEKDQHGSVLSRLLQLVLDFLLDVRMLQRDAVRGHAPVAGQAHQLAEDEEGGADRRSDEHTSDSSH